MLSDGSTSAGGDSSPPAGTLSQFEMAVLKRAAPIWDQEGQDAAQPPARAARR